MPEGANVISAESWGVSAWTKTARISVTLSDGRHMNYFLKCSTGRLAKVSMWGEHYSASIIADHLPDFGPGPVGKGEYYDDTKIHVYFYLMNYHDMDLQSPPDPVKLASAIAGLH
ncbi:Uu.00g005060.m01.CDS01 [Anthostomella pinea]|uniref:Uu.00g005060.m01.CDS01 n=1 Tax=Anthostomella pinea TaxID=933095 RepID=A0AAI8YIR8_9PEZI|nr:Uu.00g005060.m01.CDS01 [Anthostomella pinea]